MRVSYINGQISFVEETEYQSYNDYLVIKFIVYMNI